MAEQRPSKGSIEHLKHPSPPIVKTPLPLGYEPSGKKRRLWPQILLSILGAMVGMVLLLLLVGLLLVGLCAHFL